MSKKSTPKPDDPEQSKRFIETAEQVGADDEEALERAFVKIKKPKTVHDHQTSTKTKEDRSGQ